MKDVMKSTKTRTAADPALKDTAPAKSDAKPLKLKDGTPNPETEKGRVLLIKDTALSITDLLTRARILEKLVNKALDSDSREEFKEQLVLMTDGVAQLKTHDVPKLVDAFIKVLELYEKSRGRKLDINKLDEYMSEKAARTSTNVVPPQRLSPR